MINQSRAAAPGTTNKNCECCHGTIKNRKEYLICDDCVALNNLINSKWKK